MSIAELLTLFYGFMVGVGATFVWARGRLGELEAERDQQSSNAEFWEEVARAYAAEKLAAGKPE